MFTVLTILVLAALLLGGGGQAWAKDLKIAIVHLQEGNPYFDVAKTGSVEAAKELGVELIFKGPASMDTSSQIELVDALIAQKVDAIGISAIDPNALVPVGQKATKAGIKFFSWDSPVSKEGRLLHNDAASPEDLGRVETQMMARMIGSQGKVAIISAGATNENSNLWIKWIQEELKAAKYSGMKLVEVTYGDDDYQKSYNLAQALYKKYPDLKGYIAPTSVGIVAASKFVKDQKLTGKVFVTGLGLPSEMKEYIKDGICKEMALWSPIDQGYLIVQIGYALAAKKLTPKAGERFKSGRLGELAVVDIGGGNLIIYQGKPMIFDQSSIDKWAGIF
jgi:rhamnose transport system substrate-binding protein